MAEPADMAPKEIDQKINRAFGDGYLEGVLQAKEANGRALI